MHSLSDPVSEDVLLSRFLSVRDNYSGHISYFVRYLESNHLRLDLSAVRAYFKHLNALPLAAATKCVRRQAVKARLRATLSSTDFNRQARLEMTLRSLDHDSETKAPGFVTAGVAEDRIVTQGQFDLLVSGTSKRTSLFLWFLYNTGCPRGRDVQRPVAQVRRSWRHGQADDHGKRQQGAEGRLYSCIRLMFDG